MLWPKGTARLDLHDSVYNLSPLITPGSLVHSSYSVNVFRDLHL